MAVDVELVDAAISLVRNRFGSEDGAGAAAMRLADGTVLTSVGPTAPNSAVELCHEVGAICEAYKLGVPVVASVCVINAPDGHWVLAPCGVCQERLFAYGPEVEVGVPNLADPRTWRTLRLRDLQPHWFGRVFPDEDAWPV
ncbi:hypothetical protein BLA60_37130 [Actinophytocola xinjiangensis]|uniref:Cytidine deaminase n=1 Tax=Actinophytocola xinjiangensis TaxID=485602 RepID=A0A7Z0WEC8_9PSEU|nr:cytidine deaminase [Actinophytocola xinjiangensis]OLF05278.1 hypothetical protein BLA60_37130 [Actinophytocola xinjiangensis]